ncbi:MAG: hypothetical protein ACK4GP_20095, partial [Deinococcus sp.]
MTHADVPSPDPTTQPGGATADPRRTEGVHPDHPDLDRLPLGDLLDVLTDDQLGAVQAARRAAPALARAAAAAL